MWHDIKDKLPERDGMYPCWMIAHHSGYKFWLPCVWYNQKFICEGTMEYPEDRGWSLLAWYEIPPFRDDIVCGLCKEVGHYMDNCPHL